MFYLGLFVCLSVRRINKKSCKKTIRVGMMM